MGLRALLPKPAPPAPTPGPSGWHRVAIRHDVRRMSQHGLRELAHDLAAVGAISMPDRRLLSLEPVTYAAHWPGWSTFETLGEADGRRDWIDEIETRIRKGYPEYAYIAYLRSLLSFLKRVEAARLELARAAPPDAGAGRHAPPLAVPARRAPTRLTSPLPRPAST